jgi:hypothetical protein
MTEIEFAYKPQKAVTTNDTISDNKKQPATKKEYVRSCHFNEIKKSGFNSRFFFYALNFKI